MMLMHISVLVWNVSSQYVSLFYAMSRHDHSLKMKRIVSACAIFNQQDSYFLPWDQNVWSYGYSWIL